MKRLTPSMLVSPMLTRTAFICTAFVFVVVIAACGGSDDGEDGSATNSASTAACLTDDPDCADGVDASDSANSANSADVAGPLPLPSAVVLGSPTDPDGPPAINFGGFFYSDGNVSQLCSSLAESFPPQCGSVVVDIEAPLDVVLARVAESFANPQAAKININDGIYWTDNWVNLAGSLAADRLVLE